MNNPYFALLHYIQQQRALLRAIQQRAVVYRPPPYHPELHRIPEDREYDPEDAIIEMIHRTWSLPEWMFPAPQLFSANELMACTEGKCIWNHQFITTSLHVNVQVWKHLWSDNLAEWFVLHLPWTEPRRLDDMPDHMIQQHMTELLHPRLELQCEFIVFQWDALALERRLQAFWASPFFKVTHRNDCLTWKWNFEER